MERELEVAKRLAREAGKILLEFYATDTVVQWKGHDDPVTAADHAANEMIVRELRRHFPDDAVLSEEAPDDVTRLRKERVWMVDPMDGTKQFIERIGEFAVMIGLAVAGEPRVGVVYNPVTDRLFYAATGLGAYVEEGWSTKRLHVTPLSDVAQMVAARSRSHPSPTVDRIYALLGIKEGLRSGSVGLKFGLIADGQAHVYINTSTRTNQWDTCAPVVILREAGGCVTDTTGAPLSFNTAELRNLRGIVASNCVCHEQLLAAVAQVFAR
jgi:3'(2'), 5'-bisphosphate nucleotidase